MNSPQKASDIKINPTALAGIDKVSALLLSVDDETSQTIMEFFKEDEIRQITFSIANLTSVSSDDLGNILTEFTNQMLRSGSIMGGADSAERLLSQYLPKDKVNAIMEEIRGPAGSTVWEKLSNVNEQILATYLRNEYPQTIAVILSRISPEHCAKVLTILQEDLSFDVMNRMLRLESVQKDVIDKIEHTLRFEFMPSFAETQQRNPHEQMAEIFNAFDRQTEARFMARMDDEYRTDSEQIKSLMFTFDDLLRLDPAAVQTLLRNVDKDKLPIALKGAKEAIRELFFSNMSERAAKALAEEMEIMGAVRLRDVDEGQQLLVNTAKDLASRGEITINKGNTEDEMVE